MHSRRHRATRPIALACLALALLQCPSPRSADVRARLEAFAVEFDAFRQRASVPGAAVAVVRAGEPLLVRGFGTTRSGGGEPVGPDTPFGIGSLSKTYTAVLAAALVDDGTIRFEDRLGERLPGFRLADPVASAGATIEDALCHCTGLGIADLPLLASGVPLAEVLEQLATAEPAGPFRASFHYSNAAFACAGHALARAAGRDFADLLRARLLDPLGLASTHADFAVLAELPGAAAGHEPPAMWSRDWIPRAPRTAAHLAPAYGMVASARDLGRWIAFLLGRGALEGRRLVDAERFDELWRPRRRQDGACEYGLGWQIRTLRGERMIAHSGNAAGFSAVLALLPERDVGVALVANGASVDLLPAAAEALDALAPPALDAGPPLAAADRAARAGEYGRLPAPTCTVEEAGERLALKELVFPDAKPLGWPGPDGWCAIEGRAARLRFLCDAAGRAGAVEIEDLEGRRRMPRLGAGQSTWVGSYEAPRRFGQIDVLEADGAVRAIDSIGGTVVLESTSNPLEFVAVECSGLSYAFSASLSDRPDRLIERWNGATTELLRSPTPVPLPRDDDGGVGALLDRRAALHGDAFDALGDLRFSGTVRLPEQGLAGSATLLLHLPSRFRMDLDLEKFGRISYGADRHDMWFRTPFIDMDVAGRAGAPLLLQSPLAWFRDLRELASWVLLHSEVQEPGQPRLRIDCHSDDVTLLRCDLRRSDGALLAMRTIRELGGASPTVLRFEDHREVGGAPVPFRIFYENSIGYGLIEIQFDAVETGLDLPDTAFAAPDRR